MGLKQYFIRITTDQFTFAHTRLTYVSKSDFPDVDDFSPFYLENEELDFNVQ